jgi:hypothetical protein
MGLKGLPGEFDAQHPAAAPNDLAGPLVSLNEGKLKPGRNDEAAGWNDFGSPGRDIHYLALGGRHAVQGDPGRLMPNSSNLSLLFFGLHCSCSARLEIERRQDAEPRLTNPER